jgi:hypothetical protein
MDVGAIRIKGMVWPLDHSVMSLMSTPARASCSEDESAQSYLSGISLRA